MAIGGDGWFILVWCCNSQTIRPEGTGRSAAVVLANESPISRLSTARRAHFAPSFYLSPIAAWRSKDCQSAHKRPSHVGLHRSSVHGPPGIYQQLQTADPTGNAKNPGESIPYRLVGEEAGHNARSIVLVKYTCRISSGQQTVGSNDLPNWMSFYNIRVATLYNNDFRSPSANRAWWQTPSLRYTIVNSSY